MTILHKLLRQLYWKRIRTTNAFILDKYAVYAVRWSGRRSFRVDSQTVCYAIDVIEIPDHLRRIIDRPVIKPDLSQSIQVLRRHGRRRPGQFDRVITEGPIGIAELRLRVVGSNPFHPLGIVDLSPEVNGVCLDSVVTVVGT